MAPRKASAHIPSQVTCAAPAVGRRDHRANELVAPASRTLAGSGRRLGQRRRHGLRSRVPPPNVARREAGRCAARRLAVACCEAATEVAMKSLSRLDLAIGFAL